MALLDRIFMGEARCASLVNENYQRRPQGVVKSQGGCHKSITKAPPVLSAEFFQSYSWGWTSLTLSPGYPCTLINLHFQRWSPLCIRGRKSWIWDFIRSIVPASTIYWKSCSVLIWFFPPICFNLPWIDSHPPHPTCHHFNSPQFLRRAALACLPVQENNKSPLKFSPKPHLHKYLDYP